VIQIESVCHPCEALKLEIGGLSDFYEPAWYTTMNHDSTRPAWFLAWEGAVLVGYLTVFNALGTDGEVAGFVPPEYRRRGIFRELLTAARRAWGDSLRRWLLVVGRRSVPGIAVATRWGKFSFTETTLVLNRPGRPTPSRLPGDLVLAEGTADDLGPASSVFQEAIGPGDHRGFLERILADADRRFFVLWDADRPVGVGCLHRDGDETTVHGLVIVPDCQGRGWGRALLESLVDREAPEVRAFLIEVDSTNHRAESLYRRLGFQDHTVTDYYEL